MDEEIKANNKKKLAFKIIIPIIIVVAILAIWFIKNEEKKSVVDNNVASGNIVKLDEINQDFLLAVSDELDIEKLKSYGVPIVIDFGADSCTPCKEMAPVLKELNEDLQGKAIIKFVDVWKYKDLAEGYPISLIPTQVLIDKSGNPYTPKDLDAIPLNMYNSKDTEKHVFTTHEGGITKEDLLTLLERMGMKE